MAAILPQAQLAYFFVPKVACTSMKSMFFEVENGWPFRDFSVSGRVRNIHGVYGTAMFRDLDLSRYDGLTRVALVRDPVARIVSCYRNRIGGKDLLSRPEAAAGLAEYDLSPRPSLSEFVARLRRYRKASRVIRHHSHPLSTHLGTDPAYFHKLYPLREIDAFAADIRARTGSEAELPHLQTVGSGETVADLSPAETARIKELYAEDYTLFGQWF